MPRFERVSELGNSFVGLLPKSMPGFRDSIRRLLLTAVSACLDVPALVAQADTCCSSLVTRHSGTRAVSSCFASHEPGSVTALASARAVGVAE